MKTRYFAEYYNNHGTVLVPLKDANGLLAMQDDGHLVELTLRGRTYARPGCVSVRAFHNGTLLAAPSAANVMDMRVDADGCRPPDLGDYLQDPVEWRDLEDARQLAAEALAASGRKRTELLEKLVRHLSR